MGEPTELIAIERQAGPFRDQTWVHFGLRGFRCTLVIRRDQLWVETTVDGNYAGPCGRIGWDVLDALRAEVADG